MSLSIIIPLRASTSQNARLHWAALAKVRKREKGAVMAKLPRHLIRPVIAVTLTRCAPRRLDSDNLAGCLKGIRDGVAARLGIDDGSPLIVWKYEQVQAKEYSVGVDVAYLRDCPDCDGGLPGGVR